MYYRIVKQQILQSFDNISTANFEPVLESCDPNVRHNFPGTHAFGGERNTREGFAKWLDRIHRILPDFPLTVDRVLISGMPWNTTVAAQWHGYAELPTGGEYAPTGVHIIKIRWGRIISLDVYTDSEKTGKMLAELAAYGINEADEQPITT